MDSPSSPDEGASKSKVADLSLRLSKAEDPLRAGIAGPGADAPAAGRVPNKRAIELDLLRTLIEIGPDLIFVRDREQRHLLNNRAQLAFLGAASMEDTLGKNDFEFYPRELAQAFHEENERVMASGEPLVDVETLVPRPPGSQTWLSTTKVPLRDPGGRVIGLVGIARDVTEKKRREAQAIRTQRLESIGTLAGGIAHDLNNVLAPILMSIELLKFKVPDPGVHKLLDVLEVNAERGAQLVRQVLAFGRGAMGERMAIQPLHIAREIAQIVKDTFPKAIRFELISKRDLWTITGDPTQIHQVLLNLCVNARDAMPNGGSLTLQIENNVVDETFAGMSHEARPGPYVMIRITDTGTGIPHDVRERIFEPFFTTKEIGKGTGLGLSTSLGIVQSHGGFISVASEAGKGSTFKVYLPANPGAGAPAAAPKRKGLPRGQGELILVVDDEEPILDVAKSTLERFGYRVVVARNGAEAVSIYAKRGPEIEAVLTDMAMPIMDGPALAVALTAINPGVKIIGSSGLGSNVSLSTATGAGVREFVKKPYTAEILLHTLARVVGRRPRPAPRPKAAKKTSKPKGKRGKR